MRFTEFATQTKTPDQLRIDSLKATKDKAAEAIAAERQRQQVAKAQKALIVAKQSAQPKPPNP
jgi:predicted GIY-YIG superfamily endonuclease